MQAAVFPSCSRRLGGVGGHRQIPQEVEAIHRMARAGELAPEAAERQLNSYLLAIGHSDHRLVMPITDAPHHTLLPDLGNVLHRILCRQPLRCALSSVLEQAIPSIRAAPRPIAFADSQDVLLNLALAMLLGTYSGGTIKRPLFHTRARVFQRVHALLVAPREDQTAFCRAHSAVILLAAMEYAARVMPAYMPAQVAFLQERDPATSPSFRRIPPICDELRQTLDEDGAAEWPAVQAWCLAAVERISRLKKSVGLAAPRDPQPDLPVLQQQAPSALAAYWAVPRLQGGSPHEYHLLGQGLGLHGRIIQHIQQREVQVYPLPGNLRRLQLDAVASMRARSSTQAFLRTRHFVCTHCILHAKAPQHAQRLRLDTIRQVLVCSTCLNTDLLSVDMIGRVLRHKGQSYFLCPSCVSIRHFAGQEDSRVWFADGQCRHRPAATQAPPARAPCDFCSLSSGACQAWRVDHLTGQMVSFAFCQRHAPSPAELQQCANARQLASRYCNRGI